VEVILVMTVVWDDELKEVDAGVEHFSPPSPNPYWSDGDSYLSDILSLDGRSVLPLEEGTSNFSAYFPTPSHSPQPRPFSENPVVTWSQLEDLLMIIVNTASRKALLLKLAIPQNREAVVIWMMSSALSRVAQLRGILRRSILRDGSSTEGPSRNTVHWCPNPTCVWSCEYMSYLEALAVENPDSCLNIVEDWEKICGSLQDQICDGSTAIMDRTLSALMIIEVALQWNLCCDCWIYILAELNSRVVPGPGHLGQSSLQVIGTAIDGIPPRTSHPSREESPEPFDMTSSPMSHGNSGMEEFWEC
jgi:hypothetical protein